MWLPVQDGVGNSAPILSLTQCLLACESAPGCSAVVYSPGDQNCFLKGCPSEYAVTCPVRTALSLKCKITPELDAQFYLLQM